MCGIAGYLGRDPAGWLSEAAPALCAALRHRGPDAEGTYLAPSGRALLAHTRLSIVDLSPAGAQPMSVDGVRYLVFNGEIYNHPALREELEKEGEVFVSRSDTEVVLRLLSRRGWPALALLRGMFALALWDEREQSLLLARDAFGMKPLHVACTGGELAFASELRALRHLLPGGVRLNHRGLADFLTWGCEGTTGLIDGVESLPPGESWTWKDGRIERRLFSQIQPFSRESNTRLEDFRSTWLESVALHFAGDVPVGLFLSGGIDSAAVLAAAVAGGRLPSQTLTLDFAGVGPGESRQASAIASHFGATHRVISLGAAELPVLFQEHLRAQDRPSMDGFNVYCITHAARQQNLKVVLTGLGGDELFGGYPSFRRIPLMVRLLRASRISRWAGPILGPMLPHLGSGRSARLAEWISGAPTWPRAYRSYRGIFPSSTVEDIVQHMTGQPPVPPHLETLPWPEQMDPRNRVACLEFKQYLQHQLLVDGDGCSMALGVELRHPFLDEVLWRTAVSLPVARRYDPGKVVLRECLPELPRELFERSKLGFSLPYDAWLAGPLADFRDYIPLEFRPLAQTWYQRVALISLFHWLKHHRISL